MNTSPVVLQGEAAARLVSAAARVAAVPDVDLAIVGGLAVACRVGALFRATADVDAVGAELPSSVETVSSNAELLVQMNIAQRAADGVIVDDTKVQIIDTQPLTDDVADVEPVLSRLFVLAHRFALETATLTQIVVRKPDVDASMRVAIPVALFATKLHALADRHDDAKKASDAHDIMRLLPIITKPEAAPALQATELLTATVVEVATEQLVDNAERVARYVRVYGDPALPLFDGEAIRIRTTAFLRLLV